MKRDLKACKATSDLPPRPKLLDFVTGKASAVQAKREAAIADCEEKAFARNAKAVKDVTTPERKPSALFETIFEPTPDRFVRKFEEQLMCKHIALGARTLKEERRIKNSCEASLSKFKDRDIDPE